MYLPIHISPEMTALIRTEDQKTKELEPKRRTKRTLSLTPVRDESAFAAFAEVPAVDPRVRPVLSSAADLPRLVLCGLFGMFGNQV